MTTTSLTSLPSSPIEQSAFMPPTLSLLKNLLEKFQLIPKLRNALFRAGAQEIFTHCKSARGDVQLMSHSESMRLS